MVSEKLLEKYNANQAHAKQVAKLSLKIFDELKALGLHDLSVKKREFLNIGACLHDIGYFVEAKGHNKHSAELIKNDESLEFDKDEKRIIACVARYHRGNLPSKRHGDYDALSEKKQKTVQKLAGIVRFADALDRLHLDLVCDVALKYNAAHNILWIKVIPEKSGIKLDLSAAQRKKDLLEKAFFVQAVVVCF